MLFKTPLDIEIRLNDEYKRRHVDVRSKGGPVDKLPIYEDGESVKGVVHIRTKEGKRIEHSGIKVQLLGTIETNVDSVSSNDFLSLANELAAPSQLSHVETYPFEFRNVEKQYESYRGINANLKYVLRVTVSRNSTDITREKELWVYQYKSSITSEEENANSPSKDVGKVSSKSAVRMDVGIEDCLHIDFEYLKSSFSLKDVIVGKIFFLLVRLKIKHMEISLIRRETVGSPPNQVTDSSTIVRFEIMDGAPAKGETIPIRLFLRGFDLCPTYRDVNKKFSTRTYLSLVLIDEDSRRYFKQSEIFLYRDL